MVDMLCDVTGLSFTADELYSVGERIINIERLFNLREGMKVEDDTLPARFLSEPLKDGAAKGRMVPLKEMLEEYYQAREWEKDTGYPSAAKFKFLELSER